MRKEIGLGLGGSGGGIIGIPASTVRLETLTFTETLGEISFRSTGKLDVEGLTFTETLGEINLKKNLALEGLTFAETLGELDFTEIAGYATITQVGATSVENRYDTEAVLSAPAGLADGHVLVAVYGCARQETWTLPSGFQEYCATKQIGTEGDKISHSCAVKVASSESGTYTFSVPTASNMAVALFAFSGVDTSDIFDVAANHASHHPTTLNGGTTVSCPAITTNTDGAAVVQCSWGGRTNTTNISSSKDGSATNLFETVFNNANSYGHFELVPTAGTYTAATHTYTSAVADTDYISLTFALKPGPA